MLFASAPFPRAAFLFIAAASLLGACGSSECPLGTHRENGACVSNLSCGAGTVADGGVCVPTASCGPGTVLDGGVCVSATACGPGTVADGGVCVNDPNYTGPTTWRANQRVSRDRVFSAEPSVAADADGHVVVAFMEETSGGSLQTVVVVSSDRGATFHRAGTYPSRNGFSGDVAVAAGPSGAFYVAYIDYHDAMGTAQYPPSDAYVLRSTDHGATWGTPVLVSITTSGEFNDRPWVTVAQDGAVHMHWTNLPGDQSVGRAMYARSADHGASFSTPAPIDDEPGTATAPYSGNAVTPEGDFVLTAQIMDSQGTSSVGYRRSSDGVAFPMTTLASVYYTRDLQVSASPNIAIAPNGRACLVYIDAPERDPGVFFAIAESNLDFDTPRVIEEGKGTQTFPWVAADAAGRCHAIWLDNRSGDWEIWSALIGTDGKARPSERVSDARFKEDGSQQEWLGDFVSVAVGGDTRYAVWTDTRDGQSSIYFSTSPLPTN